MKAWLMVIDREATGSQLANYRKNKYVDLFVCLSGALALSMSASICDTHFSNSCNISCNDIIYFKINISVFWCISKKYPAIRSTLCVRFTLCRVREHNGSAPSFLFYIYHFYIHYLHILVNFVPEAMVFLHHLRWKYETIPTIVIYILAKIFTT